MFQSLVCCHLQEETQSLSLVGYYVQNLQERITMTQATTIAYLGPVGTYSHEAARLFAKRMNCEEIELIECPSFNEVHEAVDRGKAEFGVMPIENSLEGVVTATLDTLAFKGGVSIMGSAVLDIHHCLVLHPDANIEDIKTVVSHPQGLAQCRRYLNNRFPTLARIAASSTAEGARAAEKTKQLRAFLQNLQLNYLWGKSRNATSKITMEIKLVLRSLLVKVTSQCYMVTI